MNTYHYQYLKYKNRYHNTRQYTGGTQNKPITLTLKHETPDNPKYNNINYDGAKLNVSFVPQYYIPNTDIHSTKSIKATATNIKILTEYTKTQSWNDFIKYLFDDLRPFILPNCNPEIYYTDNITTKLINKNGYILMNINGILHHYTPNQAKAFCGDMKWKTTIDNKLNITHIYDLMAEGLYKWTQEGEMLIKGIGGLTLPDDSQLEVIVTGMHK